MRVYRKVVHIFCFAVFFPLSPIIAAIMSIILTVTESMLSLPGAVCAAVVDLQSGRTLASAGTVDSAVLEKDADGSARFLRFKMGMREDSLSPDVEDLLISTPDRYHLLRLIRRGKEQPRQFLYLIVNRFASNLGYSRIKLTEIEGKLGCSEDAGRLMEIECDFVLDSEDIRHKIERLLSGNHRGLHGSESAGDDIPAFMRTEVALKLLGVDLDRISSGDF